MFNSALIIIIGFVSAAILAVLVDRLFDKFFGKFFSEHLTFKRIIIVIVVIGVLLFFSVLPSLLEPSPVEFTGLVIDDSTNLPVDRAKVLLDLENNTSIVDTDAKGVYRFRVNLTDESMSGLLRVEAENYESYKLYITLSSDNPTIEEIRLRSVDGSSDPITDTDQETTEGKVITVYGAFSGDDATRFKKAMTPFEERLGIVIEYSSSSDYHSELINRVKTGSLPDVIAFPQPSFLTDLIRQGHIVDLNEFLDQEYLRQQYDQTWLDMATIDGKMAGVWYKTFIKSLVWYPVPEFKQAGYNIPATWDEMITLSNQMVADGYTPWCIGIESGGASGWPATDWIEDIMLRTISPENYDRWTRGELKFNSPEVRRAINIADEIWLNPKFVYGGVGSITTTFFGDSITPMFDNPPNCWLHRQGAFIPAFFPNEIEIGKDVDFFYLPPIDQEYGNPVLISGDIFAMINDRPEVREFIKYLTTGGSVRVLIEDGGTLSPHKDAQLNWYPTDIDKRYAEILIGADTIRFDGSDIMPSEVGLGSFWQGMIDYIDGREDLDTVLKEIDESWPR